MTKILFKEEQKYRPVRVRIVLPVVITMIVVFYILGINEQITHRNETGNSWYNNRELILTGIFSIVIVGGILTILNKTKLITVIDSEGIHLKYPPLRIKGRIIPKDSIGSFKAREYRARHEFGGYGYKFRGKLIRRRKYGIAFTASGNKGIQLTLKDGDKILVGTKRETAFIHALDKLMKEPSNKI